MTTTTDPDWQLSLAPTVRMALQGYQAEFGGLPATLWRVPGTVTLLASGPLRLTVATPWSAVAAAGPGQAGIIEMVLMERSGEHERVPAGAAAAGYGPAWAGRGLERTDGPAADGGQPDGYAGTRLLVRPELPDGVGAGIAGAVETSIRLCLGNPAARGPEAEHASGYAVLGTRPVPCDLAAAGLRLMLVDTRVRRAPQQAPAEDSPVAAAAAAAAAADFAALGALLTAAHEQQPGDGVQRAVMWAGLQAGALGGRAVADGPGRPVCLLVPVGRITAVRAEIRAEFARSGARAPRCLTFTPGRGPDQPAPL
jgi:hypothetical protein